MAPSDICEEFDNQPRYPTRNRKTIYSSLNEQDMTHVNRLAELLESANTALEDKEEAEEQLCFLSSTLGFEVTPDKIGEVCAAIEQKQHANQQVDKLSDEFKSWN